MEVTYKVATYVYIGKDKLYRVVSGNFADIASANKFLAQLKAKNINGIVRDLKTMKTMF
jgi:hypothetical protein